MCEDPTLLRRLKASQKVVAELTTILEETIRVMERMDALLLEGCDYDNVEKGDIVRAKKALAKYKGG